MFSSKLTRAANRATATTTVVAAHPPSSAAQRAPQCLANRPLHQRRPSSSKASCPPDSSKPAPAAKATASDEATASPSSAPTQGPRRTKRLGRVRPLTERTTRSTKLPAQDYAGLPAVPALEHLRTQDVSLSRFFSLHRPISVTAPFPTSSTPEAFASLFQRSHQPDPWENGNSAERRPEDVIYTLHNTIEALESGSSASQDEGVRWEVVQESPTNNEAGTVKHLDGPPKVKSVEELVAQFKPFSPPPAPEAFLDELLQHHKATSDGKKKMKIVKQMELKPLSRQPRRKTFQTTITVTELTYADGKHEWAASSSPIVPIPNPVEKQSVREPPSEAPRITQLFLQRMRRRQQVYLQAQQSRMGERMGEPQRAIRRAPSDKRVKMILISVKRQRKLKMKKHKYKKLMKRTRNLRRRLDRT